MTRSILFSRNHPTLPFIKKKRSTDATGGFLSKKIFVKISQYSQEKTGEYCEISKNTYYEEHLRTAASEETLASACLGLSFWRVAFKTILSQ